MAILSIHHRDDERSAPSASCAASPADAVVILTYDPEVSGRMWLMSD